QPIAASLVYSRPFIAAGNIRNSAFGGAPDAFRRLCQWEFRHVHDQRITERLVPPRQLFPGGDFKPLEMPPNLPEALRIAQSDGVVVLVHGDAHRLELVPFEEVHIAAGADGDHAAVT